ncbi:MAG: toxin-antitoxin system YwqK family antitoxin, partial [Pirellulales bacterium]
PNPGLKAVATSSTDIAVVEVLDSKPRKANERARDTSVAPADPISDDEAAIAIHIKALHDESGEARETAAAALRAIVAKYPAGTTNIRSPDGGKTDWSNKVDLVVPGMKKAEARMILPPFAKSPEVGGIASGQSHIDMYRLDNDWTVTISYRNPDTVIERPRLQRAELRVFVTPPATYTGTWICWHVNGQKADEIQYLDGHYDGRFTSYHDNGKVNVEQHYANHVAEGADTGWYPDGTKSYAGQYRRGKQVGKWVHWYANGKKRSEINYKDGRYDGLYANWYESGRPTFEQHYRDGVKHGLEAAWNEQGVLQYRREYDHGEIIESRPGDPRL